MITIEIEEEDWNLITHSIGHYAEEDNWHGKDNIAWGITHPAKAYDFGKQARRARDKLLDLNLWKMV